MLGQCSQSSYITEDLVQKLRLPRKRTNVKIMGVGGVITGTIQWIVSLKIITGIQDTPTIKTKALVVKRVTSKIPSTASVIDRSQLNQPLTLLQNTIFGWIVSGQTDDDTNIKQPVCGLIGI